LSAPGRSSIIEESHGESTCPQEAEGGNPRSNGENGRELSDGTKPDSLSRTVRHAIAVDLIPFTRFGVPMTLTAFEGETVDSFAVLGQAPRLADPTLQSFSVPTMRFLRPRGVN